MMKKYTAIFIFLVVMIALCGCGSDSCSYPFQQSAEQIVRIDLLFCEDFYVDPENYEIIKELRENEIDSFIQDLKEQNCYRYSNDPATGCSNYAIKIYYEDGESELIGENNNRYTVNGEVYLDKFYFLNDDFRGLLAKYVGEGLPII